MVVQVTYQPTVLFVLKGAKGKGDGSSWANAFTELGPVLAAGVTYPGKTNIWVSEGTYLPAAGVGFTFKSNTAITGGFADQGGDRTIDGRDLINNVSKLDTHPDGLGGIRNTWSSTDNVAHTEINFELANFTFIGGGPSQISIYDGKKVTLKNIICKNLSTTTLLQISGASTVDILNCEFSENTGGDGPFLMRDANVRILNTKIINNIALGEGGGITFGTGHLCAGGNSIIQGNGDITRKSPFFPVEVDMGYQLGASFDYEPSVTIGPGGIYDPMAYKKITIVTSCPAPF